MAFAASGILKHKNIMMYLKNKHTILVIFATAIVIGLITWVIGIRPVTRGTVSTVQIGERPQMSVVIADTPETRTQGLSGTDDIPEQGLLFVFPQAGKYGFWMKDMTYAIDVLWIDQFGKIIDITDDFTPLSYPEIRTPAHDVLYVLEVHDTFIEDQKIQIGEYVEIQIRK